MGIEHFNAGAGEARANERAAEANATRANATRATENSRSADLGKIASLGTPKVAQQGFTDTESGVHYQGTDEMKNVQAVKAHIASVGKDRSAISAGVNTAKSFTFNGEKRPLSALIRDANVHLTTLEDHVRSLAATGRSSDATGDLSAISNHLGIARAASERAAALGTGTGKSPQDTEEARTIMHQGMVHIGHALDRLYQPLLQRHPDAVVPPVSSNAVHDDIAYAHAIATAPFAKFNAAGATPKRLVIGSGRELNPSSDEGKAVLKEISKAKRNRTVDVNVAGDILRAAKPTPRKRKADKDAIRAAGLPANVESTRTDPISKEITPVVPGRERRPSTGDRTSGSNTNVSGTDVKGFAPNLPRGRSHRPEVKGGFTSAIRQGDTLEVKEGAGNDANKPR